MLRFLCFLALCAAVLTASCKLLRDRPQPIIEFTEIPEAGPGGASRVEGIAGRVRGAQKTDRIVIYARAGSWWVQPSSTRPFTPLDKNAAWRTTTHTGSEYAALLVKRGYLPPNITDALPQHEAGVIASTVIAGRTPSSNKPPKTVWFSGYQWDVRQFPSDSGGVSHENSADNVSVDERGRLHLRITDRNGIWQCSELAMLRSLGYGSYSFVIGDMPALEPGTVLGLFTWDAAEAGQNHREIDIEISRWGDLAAKNAQFVIQPYYVPANVYRFETPARPTVHSFRWEPDLVSFKSFIQTTGKPAGIIAQHSFSSGIPSPGDERVHLNLYIYGKSRTPQKHGVEVVVDRFEYLP